MKLSISRKTGASLGTVIGIISLGIVPARAVPVEYDLTGGAGHSATINGAFFSTTDNQSTGTGVIDSFVRIQNTGSEEGYNASARPVMPDVNTSPQFTRDITLSQIPQVVNPAGASPGTYYEFLLDINQVGSGTDLNISLNKLQIYTRSSPLPNGSADTLVDLTSSGATKRYDLDVPTDNRVQVSGIGSGAGDLFVYIPIGAFAGLPGNTNVYLYSMIGTETGGTSFASNDGFEEWAVRTTTPSTGVPDGGTTMAMLGFSLLCAEALRRKLTMS